MSNTKDTLILPNYGEIMTILFVMISLLSIRLDAEDRTFKRISSPIDAL